LTSGMFWCYASYLILQFTLLYNPIDPDNLHRQIVLLNIYEAKYTPYDIQIIYIKVKMITRKTQEMEPRDPYCHTQDASVLFVVLPFFIAPFTSLCFTSLPSSSFAPMVSYISSSHVVQVLLKSISKTSGRH
jgi:hypothetical protein